MRLRLLDAGRLDRGGGFRVRSGGRAVIGRRWRVEQSLDHVPIGGLVFEQICGQLTKLGLVFGENITGPLVGLAHERVHFVVDGLCDLVAIVSLL